MEEQEADRPDNSRSRKAAGAFRTISEVADILDVQQHVLRFWETKFTQVKPLKRGGGRRYYRPEDVTLLEKIHHLLYTEGYTIKGVQKLLKEQGKAQLLKTETTPKPGVAVANETGGLAAAPQPAVSGAQSNLSGKQKRLLQGLLEDLQDIRSALGDRS
ncbi:MAG: MerR family transcriptional regulator [Rhodospirillales bacterium]|nr:MerR family transcriptional regulator [Rhodospirillales bacterium]